MKQICHSRVLAAIFQWREIESILNRQNTQVMEHIFVFLAVSSTIGLFLWCALLAVKSRLLMLTMSGILQDWLHWLYVFGADVVWQDIKSMFDHWTDEITRENLVEIDEISKRYGRYENEMYQLLLHIYFGAIAEEHYQRVYADGSIKRTKVGKLMKLYALHRLLLEGVDPLVCATETVNIAPQRLLAFCEARGLKREVTWKPYSSKIR